MEKLKVKHDHTLTDILKVLIFFIFLMLPMLTYLPNALYYGFNEHATNTETTTINYKYESNEVNSLDDLVTDNVYHLTINNKTSDYFISSSDAYFDFVILKTYHYNFNNYDFSLEDYITAGNSSSTPILEFIIGNEYYTSLYVYLGSFDEDFLLELSIGNTDQDYWTLEADIQLLDKTGLYDYTVLSQADYNVIESVSVNTDDTITDKMSQAWERMWQTPMYTWIDNNTFKFTINSFTNVFNISQESYIANYLTYILVITCIYLIFDIVITLTTKLTHLINEK